MSENSLTFLPLDDPEPKVAKHVIEKGYDGSEKTAVKGQCEPFIIIGENSSLTEALKTLPPSPTYRRVTRALSCYSDFSTNLRSNWTFKHFC